MVSIDNFIHDRFKIDLIIEKILFDVFSIKRIKKTFKLKIKDLYRNLFDLRS